MKNNKQIFQLGQKVIVNTGGDDTIAHIDYPVKNVHGYFWRAQNLYLCRFTDNSKKLLCNGAVKFEGGLYNVDKDYVHANAQYIPADCIREYETATATK